MHGDQMQSEEQSSKYVIMPEYDSIIEQVVLPETNTRIDDLVLKIEQVLKQYSMLKEDLRVDRLTLSRMVEGNTTSYSLWVRDPAIFIGYDEFSKPLFLMSDNDILLGRGNFKDMIDAAILSQYFESKGFNVKKVPFFVIGGDCVLTDKYAFIGWLTSGLTSSYYQSFEKAIDVIKKAFNSLGLEAVILDDVNNKGFNPEVFEEVYFTRQRQGFFHLDTLLSFVKPGKIDEGFESNATVYAVVADPANFLLSYKEKSLQSKVEAHVQGYINFVKDALIGLDFEIVEAPAIVSNAKLWTPTNSIVDGKTVFLTDSLNQELNNLVENVYKKLGLETVFVSLATGVEGNSLMFELQQARAGLRCMCQVVRNKQS